MPWGAQERLGGFIRGDLGHLKALLDLETLVMSEVLPVWPFNPLAIRILLCSSPSQRPNMCATWKVNLESVEVHSRF